MLDMQVNACIYYRQVITCVFNMPDRHDTDVLFKALADPSRRMLLDLLHAHDGRTLNELCEHVDMTRQGVTQHLALKRSGTQCGSPIPPARRVPRVEAAEA